MQSPLEGVNRADRRASEAMAAAAIPMLRVALGVTYLWFGTLKILGASPVSDLVGKMSFGLPSGMFVKIMGVWECALGVGLLFRLALRLTTVLYFLQLAGTFMVFFAHPREAFRGGNPFLLTERGEFIIKNLVLLAAGVAVGSTARHGRDEIPHPAVDALEEAREVNVSRGE